MGGGGLGAGRPLETAVRRGTRRVGGRGGGSDRATAPRGPRRSVRGWAAGDGPWCRSPCPACDRASWAVPPAGPWRRVRPGACRRGSPRRVGGGGGRSRLAGRKGIVAVLG